MESSGNPVHWKPFFTKYHFGHLFLKFSRFFAAHPAEFELPAIFQRWIWRSTVNILGGGRSILLSYGCMALIFKASSVFRLRVSANISNTFWLVVRTGSDISRRSFEHAFANSEDFHSASRRLTISVFHQKALAGQYLRRRPLYPTELRVQGLEKYKLQRHFCQIKMAENGSLTIF